MGVPSWQQLANPANAAEANLLQPLFAAAASEVNADWRRPIVLDSSGGLRLQAEQAAAVFPAVVYERAAVAANARASSSYSKRPSKSQSSTVTSASLNPPPAHSNSYSAAVRNYNVKKEPSQLSPVKKRIKETKDHYQYELYRQQQQQQQHSPIDPYGRPIIIQDTPPLPSTSNSGQRKIPEVITISDSDEDESSPETSTSVNKPTVVVTSAPPPPNNSNKNIVTTTPSTTSATTSA